MVDSWHQAGAWLARYPLVPLKQEFTCSMFSSFSTTYKLPSSFKIPSLIIPFSFVQKDIYTQFAKQSLNFHAYMNSPGAHIEIWFSPVILSLLMWLSDQLEYRNWKRYIFKQHTIIESAIRAMNLNFQG